MQTKAQGKRGIGKSLRDLGIFGSPAQGTVEYLVILAVIVLVSLTVVTLLSPSASPSKSISETTSRLYWGSQPISIVESEIDSNGDAALVLSARETSTIKTVTINGEEIDVPDTKLFVGNSTPLLLNGLDPCSGEVGYYTIEIEYESELGLDKRIYGSEPLIVTCSDDVSSESIISDDYTDATETTIDLTIYVTDCNGLQNIDNNLYADYALSNDIDCSDDTAEGGILWNGGEGFQPIGEDSPYFEGAFDGAGYKITGIHINRPSTDYVGFFSRTTENSSIQNIGLEDVNISGKSNSGGIIGRAFGTVNNSYVTGVVKGASRTGIFIGLNDGNISDSYSDGNVRGSEYVGGFVGRNNGSAFVEGSHSHGIVRSGGQVSGGFVGINQGIIRDSYSDADTFGDWQVGGFAGQNAGFVIGPGSTPGLIEDSYAIGDSNTSAVPSECDIGGFVATNVDGGLIKNSFATGGMVYPPDDGSDSCCVGGFVGYNDATIEEVYFYDHSGFDCYECGSSPTSCTAETPESYFYNISNEPVLDWNFPPWDNVCDESGYPPLSIEGRDAVQCQEG